MRVNIWWNLLITTGLGAVIGGYTNHVAIQMLFRPHEPVYIGKYRVPFTPGLIPKRRDELARQMGRMVVEHLLTPEGIEKRLQNEAFRNEITQWAQTEAGKLLQTDRSVRELLAVAGATDVEGKGQAFVQGLVQNKLNEVFDTYGALSLAEALPADTKDKIGAWIPKAADMLVQKGIEYFESEAGKRRLSQMVDDFFASRGTLLNLVGMFLGNANLAERIQPEIIKFLRQGGAQKLLTEVIEKEWQALQERKIGEAEELLSRQTILDAILRSVNMEEAIGAMLDRPVRDFLAPYAGRVQTELTPSAVNRVFQWISSHLPTVMKRLHLSEIVEGEVATFSTERLEDLILSIMKSELKAITYLGALLGGLIGIVQGLVMQLMS